MTTAKPCPRPGVLDIQPYKAGESKIPGVDRIIKLSSNEGAFGPSPAAIKAMADAAHSAHRYPDGGCTELRSEIAKAHGLDANRIVCGAGSDELISLICQAYAGMPNSEIVYHEHGFLMYGIYAKTVGATVIKAPEKNKCADVDALLDAVTKNTRIVFLTNPNNPTATCIPQSEVERLAENLPEDVLLVIDAAYAEFVDNGDYNPGTALADKYENVAMLRTFSKIYGLGGIRLGWCYAADNIIDVLNRMRSPFNVSALAQAAGVAAVNDTDFVEKSRSHNSRWLPELTQAIRATGLDVTDSVCNFVLITFDPAKGFDAIKADEFLRTKGIIIRRVAAYGLPHSLRATIGTDEENKALVEALENYVETVK